MLAGVLYCFTGFASGRTLWFGSDAGASSASTSISVPLGRTTSLIGAGFGAILGLLKALEPLIYASDFNGVLSLTPLAQVRQLAVPVRFFKIASTAESAKAKLTTKNGNTGCEPVSNKK